MTQARPAQTQWSDRYLDSMRSKCDPVADELIREYFDKRESDSAHKFMLDLMNYRIARRGLTADRVAPIPQRLVQELKRRAPSPNYDVKELYPALRFFRDYGPELLTMLGYYSLPTAYAAVNGAHVLHATGYLEHRTMRRVIETAQLVIDVLKTGGLGPDGDGIESAYEVRLMHASIRHLIWGSEDWDDSWGEPINQEDLAGTLLTFSTLILDGFDKLNVYVSPATKESYFKLWKIVGSMLGLNEALIPADYSESKVLWQIIFRRQMKGSPIGRTLYRALSDAYEKMIPAPFAKELNSSFFRFYLDPKLADELHVPKRFVFDFLGHVLGRAFGPIEEWVHSFPLGRDAYRWFSRSFILGLMITARGHDMRTPFDIPLELSDYWEVPGTNSQAR